MNRVFVFPGQGAQKVGMGVTLAEAFPVARETLEEVDEAIGQNLFRLMRNGPDDELALTENAQPALMAVSIATLRVLCREAGSDVATLCTRLAGHSLGEYSALVAGGALTLGDAARLLRLRGQAMQEAVPVGKGAMAAFLGLEREVVESVIEQTAAGEVLEISNDNAPGQLVVSGTSAAVGRAVENIRTSTGGRAIELPVSAPFHCLLLEPAARRMEEALGDVKLRDSRPAIVANVTATTETGSARIRELLVRQVCSCVRWRESVAYLRSIGIVEQVELGAGKILSGLARRIDKEITVRNAGNPGEIEAILKAWR